MNQLIHHIYQIFTTTNSVYINDNNNINKNNDTDESDEDDDDLDDDNKNDKRIVKYKIFKCIRNGTKMKSKGNNVNCHQSYNGYFEVQANVLLVHQH